jgi:NAD(P)-dependent dehydrogenase (short-subunit alcohol dehydrogenase family)
MRTPVSEQVVVITGASSGIGRCTALHLAARGARVVVTARRAEALESLVLEIEAEGGRALAVPGDVTREEDLRAVARAAVERWGRIDTWVNNAGIYIQGRVRDVTLEEYRRVLEVNLLGLINGTRCALEPMLRQGSGVIVQVSSVAARRGVPYNAPYSASKAGIDGFTDALRAEIWGRGVRISVLYPPPVDTPIYQHARGKLGVQPKPTPPISYPAEAARKIAELAETGDREAYFGWARPLALLDRVAPAAADWLLHHGAASTWADRPPEEEDNLYRPSTRPPTVRGGWAEPGWRGVTLREVARVLPWESVLGAVTLGFLAGRASRRLGRGR